MRSICCPYLFTGAPSSFLTHLSSNSFTSFCCMKWSEHMLQETGLISLIMSWMRTVARCPQSTTCAVLIRFWCSHQTKIWLQNLQILSRKAYLPYSGPLGQVAQVCQEIPVTIIKNDRMACIKFSFIHPLRPPMTFHLKTTPQCNLKVYRIS